MNYPTRNVQSTSDRKTRRVLSLERKVHLIREAAKSPHKTNSELAEEFDVCSTLVWSVLKQKSHFLGLYEKSAGEKTDVGSNLTDLGPQRFSSNSVEGQKLEAEVLEWYKTVVKDTPVTRLMLQEKALELARKLELDHFSASYSWMNNFTKRYDITLNYSLEKYKSSS